MPPEQPRRPSSTRRRLLKGAGLAATAALSGCIATMPPLTQRVRYGRVEVPEGSEPAYREWIPAPSERPDGAKSEDGYPEVMYHTPGNMGEDALGAPFTLPGAIAKAFLDYFGIGYESYEWVTSTGTGNVLVIGADLDRASVGRTLTETVYERVGSYHEYDLFARRGEDKLVGVSEGTIVYGTGPHDGPARPSVEAVIDASAGRAKRYHEADPGFERLTEVAGASPMTWFVESPFESTERALGGTVSFRFDREAAYFLNHLLYPEGVDPPKAKVRRELSERSRPVSASAVDLRVDGRMLTVEMRMDAGTYRRESSTSVDEVRVPQVTWDSEYDPTAETFTVRHVAGEPFDPGPVTVEVRSTNQTYNREIGGAAEKFAGPDGTIGPGDEVTVEVGPRDALNTLRMTYESEDGDSTTTVYSHGFDEE